MVLKFSHQIIRFSNDGKILCAWIIPSVRSPENPGHSINKMSEIPYHLLPELQ